MNPEASDEKSREAVAEPIAEMASGGGPPATERELVKTIKPGLIQILAEVDRLLKQGESSDFKDSFNGLRNVQAAARHLVSVVEGHGTTENTTAFFSKLTQQQSFESFAKTLSSPKPEHKATLLIVDDDAGHNEMTGLLLEQLGYAVEKVESGEEGLFLVQSKPFDLVLLDLMLPGMHGFDVLKCLKDDIELRNVPVLILSGADQTETVIRCIESGAEDFLPKPINPVLLKARIEASLEKKRLRDQEKGYLDQLQAEQEKSEALLLNILPKAIADRLKAGESSIVDAFNEVTVLFADIVGFTDMATRITTDALWKMLNEIFSEFDRLAELHNLEKIKTIGDAYMIVGGLPTPRPDHAEAIAEMAVDMQSAIFAFNSRHETRLKIRIGINTGPVIAGIIGKKKFIYDLWGDTVNTASRMESHGHPGHIQITEPTYEKIKDRFIFAKRGTIHVKSKGEMMTYLIMARKPPQEAPA